MSEGKVQSFEDWLLFGDELRQSIDFFENGLLDVESASKLRDKIADTIIPFLDIKDLPTQVVEDIKIGIKIIAKMDKDLGWDVS